MLEQAQVVRQCLGETEAWVKNDSVCIDARRSASGHPLFKISRNVRCHIIVMRVVLHIARLTAHVHQAHRQTGIGRRVQGTIALQRAYVVDQPSPQPRRLADDRRRGGIDRNDHIQAAIDCLDHRRHALDFFGHRHGTRPRARRLATDVDQRGACGDHRFGMPQRSVALAEAPAVREGVGGDIEDTHDMGTRQIKNPVAARQPGRVLH